MRVSKGIIIMWNGATIPDGWVICDGNNDTPNLYDKFILSYGSTYSTIKDSGGESDHVLTINEMPTHDHNVSLGTGGSTHAHTYPRSIDDDTSTGSRIEQAPAPSSGSYSTSNADDTAHTHTLTINNNTGDVAHENMPPYYVLAFIMKT